MFQACCPRVLRFGAAPCSASEGLVCRKVFGSGGLSVRMSGMDSTNHSRLAWTSELQDIQGYLSIITVIMLVVVLTTTADYFYFKK